MPERRDPAVESALTALGCRGATGLAIGGLPARALAAQFGTPLYAFDGDLLAAHARAVANALGPRIELLYSVKANPSIALAAVLQRAGLGAEIASAGELLVAAAAGWPAGELRFAGPGKTDAELAFALQRGLGTFHVESADELQALARLAAAAGRRARVAVRVNLPQGLGGARARMSGQSSRFGVDQDQVPGLLRAVADADQLELAGLHVYAGTQCFDADAIVAHAAAILAAADGWERDLGLRLDEVDLGGGFGVPVYQGDPSFDLQRAAAGLRELVARHDRPGRRFLVELGRYLVAPVGVYLARVVRTKTSGGVRHVVLDGGLHHCAIAAGIGSVLRRPPLLVAAEALQAAANVPTAVGGPLCTPLDQFAAECPLPELGVGDLVAVLQVGAYGLSYSPVGFLGHPAPAEVLIEGGRARVVRARGEYGDALARQEP